MTANQTLSMTLPLQQLPTFSLLLQQGIWMNAELGVNLTKMLTDQFGVSENYISERITTLFVDGQAIDDPEKTYLKAGSTLALSSAMPGLVGATMRRGGHLAAMREAITYHSPQRHESGIGRIRIKLFNMVMTELGANFLNQGIILSATALGTFLHERAAGFWQCIGTVVLNQVQIEPLRLSEALAAVRSDDEILFKVEFPPSSHT